MSEVIDLFPDTTQPESFDDDTRDQILISNRDEMLDAIQSLVGRIHAFDVRGLVFVAFGANPSGDVVFNSSHTGIECARTVGALEFVKHDIIRSRMEEYEDEMLD